MCFLRIRPEHAPMNPPGAAPTLTNIYNDDKYFASPSYASPSDPNAVSPQIPTHPRGSSHPPLTAPHAPQQQQKTRHKYPRYHHHEDRRAAAGEQPTPSASTATKPSAPKTKRRKQHDLTPCSPPIETHIPPNPSITTITNGPAIGSSKIEQRTRTKISESLDVVGDGGLVHEAAGGVGASSSLLLGGVEEDDGGIGRGERVEGMRREVEGLEREVREVRGIGRAL